MAANGVIGITASILESSDIPESANNPENQLSFFERIKLWVKGLSKNWKSMVAKGAQVGFYALLASSKIMQGITSSMFGIIGALIDILLAPTIPFLSKGIQWLANIVTAIGDFIKNMPETFKKIWEPIWDWITGLASSAGSVLQGLFDDKAEEKLPDYKRNQHVRELLGSDKGPIVGAEEREGFLEGTATKHAILTDAPLTQEDIDEEKDYYETQILPSEAEMAAADQSYKDASRIPEGYDPRGPATWMHKGGPDNPRPITQMDAEMAHIAGREGDEEGILLVDEKLDGDEEMNAWYDSWIDEIPEFSWDDLWSDLLPEDWDPVGTIVEMWNNATGVTKKDMAQKLIDTAIDDAPYKAPGIVLPGENPGGIRNPRFGSDARGDRPIPSAADFLGLSYLRWIEENQQ